MDFDNITNKFSSGAKDLFLKTREQVSKLDELEKVSEDVQRDVATSCMMLIEETPLDEKDIVETSFVIANSFIWNRYDERLERAINLFGDLETPLSFESLDGFRLWDRAKHYLLMYLDDELLILRDSEEMN